MNNAQPVPGRFFLPRLGMHLLGVAAIIVGVLGMHVWMGAHTGSVADGHVDQSVSGAPWPATDHVTGGGLHAVTPAGVDTGHGDGVAAGCAGSCGHSGMDMAGACVLALMVISIATLLSLRVVLTGPGAGRRGPPTRRASSAAPARPPSLVQLCISRT